MLVCPYCGTSNEISNILCHSCGAELSAVHIHLPIGSKLSNGRYSIGSVLGEGGFGITYQGADTRLKRPVAIKELFPDGSLREGKEGRGTALLAPPRSLGSAGFAEAKSRFIEEAETLARFNHDSIVRVLDVFEGNGTAYLVMEFLRGNTLSYWIGERGQLPAAAVQNILEKIADGLTLVHSSGLLHRDIKPDNILLTKDKRAVLIDFGSARTFSHDNTIAATRLVTPGYAPLEQYSSRAKFGPYTDIYALAATLYHALSGQAPLPATDRIIHDSLEPLAPTVPKGLRQAIDTALRIRIEARPQSIDAFLALLNEDAYARVGVIQPVAEADAPNLPQPSAAASQQRARPSLQWGKDEVRQRVLQGHVDVINALCLSRDGRYLASASHDKTVIIWDVRQGRALHRLEGHNDWVLSVSFSPDGSMLASSGADADKTVKFWNVQQGTLSGELSWQHSDAITAVAFSPSGRLFASASFGVVKLWDTSTWQLSRSLEYDEAIYNLSFNPSGSLIAVSGSQAVQIWRANSGVAMQSLRGEHEDSVRGIAFHPDGKTIATGAEDADKSIKLWDISLGNAFRTFKGHNAGVLSLAFHPQGKLLASGSRDRSIRLWDVSSQTQVSSLKGHDDAVRSLAFHPSGNALISAGQDRNLFLWQLRPNQAAKTAKPDARD